MMENKVMKEIHTIREKNYEATKNMTWEEKDAYYEKGAKKARKKMGELKAKKFKVG